MFVVELYNFSKRINSTARPVGAGLDQIEGELFHPCSILEPEFYFIFEDGFSPAIYNYALVREFKEQGTSTVAGRFYYINNWRWEYPFWVAVCANDPLASWRDEIGEHEEYIARSSQVWDGTICDTTYPAKYWVTKYKNDIDFGMTSELGNGNYVISIVNQDGNVGATSYYSMTGGNLMRLLNDLMSDKIYDDLPEFTLQDVLNNTGDVIETTRSYLNKEVFKYQFNPIQYIISCKFYPFSLADIEGSSEFIKIGYWQSTALGRKLTGNLVKYMSKNVKIPSHPQSADRGTYLNAAPYSRYKIYAGTLGSCPIDSLSIQGVDSLDCDLSVDLITGNAKLVAGIPSHTTNFIVAELQGGIGVEIPIAQIAFNYLGGAVATVQTVSNAVRSATRLDIAGAISSTATGIESMIQAWLPQMSVQGQAGSVAGLKFPYQLESEHIQIVDEDLANRGRPYCKIRKISEVSKFMICPDPNLSLPCTSIELDQIKDFMQRGFYWE